MSSVAECFDVDMRNCKEQFIGGKVCDKSISVSSLIL